MLVTCEPMATISRRIRDRKPEGGGRALRPLVPLIDVEIGSADGGAQHPERGRRPNPTAGTGDSRQCGAGRGSPLSRAAHRRRTDRSGGLPFGANGFLHERGETASMYSSPTAHNAPPTRNQYRNVAGAEGQRCRPTPMLVIAPERRK